MDDDRKYSRTSKFLRVFFSVLLLGVVLSRINLRELAGTIGVVRLELFAAGLAFYPLLYAIYTVRIQGLAAEQGVRQC